MPPSPPGEYRRAYLRAKTVLTSAHDRITTRTPSTTVATPTASPEPDRTRASTTAARLATAAASTTVSVTRVCPSSSASRLVPSESRGQLIRHTQTSRPPAATAQPTSTAISGTPATVVSPAARRPPPRQISRRRHDRIVGRGPAATAVLPGATLTRWPRSGPARARSRCRLGAGGAPPTRTEHGTDAPVLLVLEHLVALRPVVERHHVGGEVLGLHLVPAHAVEDLRDVAVPVLLRAAQGQRLVHHRAEGELVHEAGEDAEGEDRPALAAGVDRLAHRRGPVGLQPHLLLHLVVEGLRARAVRLHAHCLDADVRSPATGHLAQLGGDVDILVVEGLRPDVRADLLEPVVEPVDDDDPLGAHEHGRAGSHLTHSPCTPHRDDVTRPHLGLVGPRPAGRRRVGGEQRPLVGDAVGDGEDALVGVGHPDVGRVAARPAAHCVGVPVAAADGLAPQRLGDPRVGIAVVAQRPQPLPAVPTLPTAGEGDHHHAVAHLVLRHAGADLGDRAHELVPEHVPRAHGRDVAAHQVQVRAAGRTQPYLEDDVVAVEDPGLGDVLDADLVDPAPGHRLHRTPALGATRVHASNSTPPGVAVRLPCGAGSTASTSPTSMSCLARRSADRRSACGSLPFSRLTALPDGPSRSRAASSVPLPSAAGRTRTSIRSPNSARGAGSCAVSTSVGSRNTVTTSHPEDGCPPPAGRAADGSMADRTWRTTLPPARAARDATFPIDEVMPDLPHRRTAGRGRTPARCARRRPAGRPATGSW